MKGGHNKGKPGTGRKSTSGKVIRQEGIKNTAEGKGRYRPAPDKNKPPFGKKDKK